MFRDTDKKTWPTEINENTATIILLNAIEEYIGGEALDSELSPENPETERALEDMDRLVSLLWMKYRNNRQWGELAEALEHRIMAKREWLARKMRSEVRLIGRRDVHHDHCTNPRNEPPDERKTV